MVTDLSSWVKSEYKLFCGYLFCIYFSLVYIMPFYFFKCHLKNKTF